MKLNIFLPISRLFEEFISNILLYRNRCKFVAKLIYDMKNVNTNSTTEVESFNTYKCDIKFHFKKWNSLEEEYAERYLTIYNNHEIVLWIMTRQRMATDEV